MGFKLFLTLFAILVFVGTHFCSIVRLYKIKEKQLVTNKNYYNNIEVHGKDDITIQVNDTSEENSPLNGENGQCAGPIWQKLKDAVKHVAGKQKKKANKKKTFVIRPGPINWYDAWRLCEQDGMRFASITSLEEKNDLDKVLKNSKFNADFAWIGGQNQNTDAYEGDLGRYVWVNNGQYLSYTNWYSGNPSGKDYNCICLNDESVNYAWSCNSCNDHRSFICEY